MDSSSDSEEFYECDDDLDEDVSKTTANEPKKEILSEQHVPAAAPNIKAQNTDNNETNTKSITRKESVENNQNISEKCNNNQEKKNKSETTEDVSTTIKNNNTTTIDATKSVKQEQENAKIMSASIEPKIENLNENKPSNLVKNDQLPIKSSKAAEKNSNVKETENIVTKPEKLEDKTQVVEDMWEDNGWGDIDQSLPVKETYPKASDDNLAAEVKISDIPQNKSAIIKEIVQETTKKNEDPEENLWDDEDDWGKLEPESKSKEQAAEEDLWGDDDGWGVNTPQETPEKCVQQVPQSTSVNKQSDEADLWAEGDNWGIDDDAKSKSTTSDAKSALDALTNKDESSWSGWSNWGITSVLSTAANITTSVSQGLTTVLENGIGVPDPAELARIHKAEAESRRQAGEDEPIVEESSEDNFVPFGLGNFVPGVSKITKLVETTGTKVITRGLGTLETIGKKTYEVLQENDPQLRKKRALLKYLEGEKPVLSSILREAKERAETENIDREKRHFAKKANYETMFDDYTGLVHLEALEMLSKQCEFKLESILSQSRDVNDVQETMEQIKDLCELNTDEDDDEDNNFDDLKSKMTTAIDEINIGITCEKVVETYEEVAEWIESTNSNNPDEIHSNAIENLAKLTAMAVEQYHKAAELLLVKEHRSTADEADSLVQ